MPSLETIGFDPGTHTSTDADGRDVPHVTAILKAAAVTQDFEKLAKRFPKAAAALEIAGPRGQAVHADCHAYDDNDLVWSTVHPEVEPFVQSWATCRENMGLVPLLHERRVYHPLHHYTGFLDGVFRCDGKRILGDIKTGDPESAAGHLQTAAYEDAYLAGLRLEAERVERDCESKVVVEPIDERWAIWLRPSKCIPYTIINYTAWPQSYADFQVFLACLCVYRNQPDRRKRVT